MTKSGTGTWDLGRGDSGTWGRGDTFLPFVYSQNLRLLIVTALFPGLSPSFV